MNDLIKSFLDKKVIDSLSTLLSTTNADELKTSAVIVANSFESGKYEIDSEDDEIKLISSFKRNLSLLVEKTWVEKDDTSLKEEILYKLEQFCIAIEKGKWKESYTSFINILNNVSFLMFGSQTQNPEFEEYAYRIDPEFGIFWWYIRSLPSSNDWSDEKNKAIQNVAMFFLANY